jgi:DNA-directed RNA polymerase subunit RPC12/RpoP
MEINNTRNNSKESVESSKHDEPIQVRAVISCPNCGYKKKFRNQFLRKDLELLTVAVKVFDYITCNKCGDLIKLDLELNI